MQKVLRKRIFRDFKENLPRYLALAFLLILSMYMVVSVVGAAETVMRGTTTEAEKQNVEDGQFSLFVPMKESEWDELTDKGITLEKMFFLDYAVDGDKTIRVSAIVPKSIRLRFARVSSHRQTMSLFLSGNMRRKMLYTWEIQLFLVTAHIK